MLQTFADLRGMVASVRRVRATLSELPPDESMAQALPPLPSAPWEYPADGGAGVGLPDEGPAPAAAPLSPNGALDGGGAVAAAQAGDLRLEGVSFSYPTRPGAMVLRDLTLTLPRGKVTAVVGRSGAGKSTVAALLERLYAPDAGAITLDGRDIRGFARHEWCASLAAVSQEPVLFPASIAYNIGARGWEAGEGCMSVCAAVSSLALFALYLLLHPSPSPHEMPRCPPPLHRLRATDAVQPGGD